MDSSIAIQKNNNRTNADGMCHYLVSETLVDSICQAMETGAEWNIIEINGTITANRAIHGGDFLSINFYRLANGDKYIMETAGFGISEFDGNRFLPAKVVKIMTSHPPIHYKMF